MALKLVWRFVNTVSKEGSDLYRMVLSAWRWIRESHAARATSLIYTEKRVGLRIEPCGTLRDYQRSGQQALLFTIIHYHNSSGSEVDCAFKQLDCAFKQLGTFQKMMS